MTFCHPELLRRYTQPHTKTIDYTDFSLSVCEACVNLCPDYCHHPPHILFAAHAVVVADLRVLVVGRQIPRLGGQLAGVGNEVGGDPQGLLPCVWTGSPAGGCRPTARSAARISMAHARFKANATTVARPVGVKPMIESPSADQMKCSSQRSRRGLNKGTSSPEVGSTAVNLSDFLRLQ